MKNIFGEPYESGGVTVIPVMSARGSERLGEVTRPVGAYIVSNGDATWHPAVDVNRIVVGGQVALVLLAVVARGIVREAKRRG
jgi:hypothetical protein